MMRKKLAKMALIAMCATPLLVIATIETTARRHTGRSVPSLKDMLKGPTQELVITKMKGGWKYKEPSVSNSQQSCLIGGVYTTMFQNFHGISNISIWTGGTHAYTPTYTGTFTGFEHSFAVKSNLIKNGTSYKEKFYQNSPKGGNPVCYGMFQGKIANNQMTFLYLVPKGNESGMMVETGHYGWIRDCRTQEWFAGYCKEKTYGASQVLFKAADPGAVSNDVAYGEGNCRVKMAKSASKAKLQK